MFYTTPKSSGGTDRGGDTSQMLDTVGLETAAPNSFLEMSFISAGQALRGATRIGHSHEFHPCSCEENVSMHKRKWNHSMESSWFSLSLQGHPNHPQSCGCAQKRVPHRMTKVTGRCSSSTSGQGEAVNGMSHVHNSHFSTRNAPIHIQP